MAGAARLFPASPKPAGGLVTPAIRAPAIKFARAARDPRFARVIAQLQQSARRVGQRPPAKRKAEEAQAAAKAPPNEKEAGARAYQVDDMKAAKAEKPNKGGFLAILRAEIDKVMPKTLDDADKFMEGGESGQIKGAVGKNVSEQKEKASGPTEEATKAAPDTGKVEGKEVTDLPADPAVVAPRVAGADAMPAPKPQAEVVKVASDASASADQKVKDAELTEPQLKKANDPRFSSVLTTRDKAKETAAAGPAKYKASETAALNQAKAGATGDASRGVAGLATTKNATGTKNLSRAQLAKAKDEAERKKVVDTIAQIFDKTKAKVEEKLSTLETDAMAIFDAGADSALARMKTSANDEIERYKDDRYSGIIGKGRWVADLFGDTPPAIKAIIARARVRFTDEMDALAVRVAALVDARLAEAKAIVAAGQGEIKTFVASLAPNLRSVGEQAQQDIQSKFDELKQSIDDKAQDLAEKFAQKYKDASDKADTAAKEMEEANKGALRALAEKIAEIAKMLAQFADRVVSLFKKAAGVVKKIIADPIGFLGNLLSAVKQGIGRFVDNIGTHIRQGFMTWLFGALTKGGIQIPAGLPAPGAILKLVLNVMGLTWPSIRPKIVKKVGERAMGVLEKVVELLEKLFTGGPEALWAELKAFVGDLKVMVLDVIIDWVVARVIKSAMIKVASMFNPAGAIIQAILMIYDVASWLIKNLDKILDFIESVLNSVDRIANGDIGGAAAFIEASLAKMIPILIGFLAALLGLGGLADKVKSLILKVQTAVGKAVDFVIDKVWNAMKKLFGAITGKGKKAEDADPEKQKKIDAGIKHLHAEEAKRLKNGKLTLEDAGKAAAGVKAAHPVFKSITPVEKGDSWVYRYVASPPIEEPGAPRELFLVYKKDVTWTEKWTKNEWQVDLFVAAGGEKPNWGYIVCPLHPDLALPLAMPGPSMLLENKTKVGGKAVQLKLADGSFTDLALEIMLKLYTPKYGELKMLTGSLADKNLANFQREYAVNYNRGEGMSKEAAADAAIRAISFGRARMALKPPFDKFTVEMSNFGIKSMGDLGDRYVPKTVHVIARR